MSNRQGSLLYRRIADDIRRYSAAITLYKRELRKDLDAADRAYYMNRIDQCQRDLDEMIDVIEFMDKRYELLDSKDPNDKETT